MNIYLDSSDINQVKKFLPIIDGITTNPLILEREGGDVFELAELIFPRPISIEVCGDMKKEALKYHKVPNAVIKVPLLSPDGSDNINLIRGLSDLVKINCTALFTTSQAVIAERAGAKYVSIFAGRIDDEGGDYIQIIDECMRLLTSAELIAGSIRTVGMALDCLKLADIVTIPPNILNKMVTHQNSLRTVRDFEEANSRLSK
jgi:transaldolase